MLQIVLEPQPAVFVISRGKCKKDHFGSPNEEDANNIGKHTRGRRFAPEGAITAAVM